MENIFNKAIKLLNSAQIKIVGDAGENKND